MRVSSLKDAQYAHTNQKKKTPINRGSLGLDITEIKGIYNFL